MEYRNTYFGTVLWITIVVLVVPVFIGVLVSISVCPELETSNDWIGFWGGYAGAIVGGIITLLVMQKTLESNRKSQERDEKRQLCNHVAKLVSDFCIEMMAYRSKMKTLSDQAHGGAIPPEKKIEMGATTEKPRRILFEMEILLSHIPEAKETLEYMDKLLDEGKIVQKTVRETENLLDELRKLTKQFIQEYMNNQKAKKALTTSR